VRLPYEVNEFNTRIFRGPNRDNPDSYEIAGTDIIWRFADLEPTARDDVEFYTVHPRTWENLLAAEQQVAANPDSAEAHLALARARASAVRVPPRGSIGDSGPDYELAQLAGESYMRAIELDPDNVEIYIAYLDSMFRIWDVPFMAWLGISWWPDDVHWNCVSILERALTLAPNDERLLEMQEQLELLVPTPTRTPRPTFTPQSTWMPSPTPTSTATSLPTSTPSPTLTITPTPMPTPSPSTGGGGAGVLVGALGGVLLLTGAVWLIWRGRSIRR
jgi:hypothetical protein